MKEKDKPSSTPFARLEEVYSKMPAPEEESPIDRREVVLKDGSTITVTKLSRSVETSFGVRFQGIYFSVTKEGLQHFSLPSLNITLSGQKAAIDVRPFLEFKDDRTAPCDALIDWIENSIHSGKVQPHPFKLNLAI